QVGGDVLPAGAQRLGDGRRLRPADPDGRTVEHRARARPAGQGTHDLGEQPTGGGERDVDDRLLLEHRSPVVGERLPPAAGDGCGAAGAPGDRLVDDDVVRPGGDVHPDV